MSLAAAVHEQWLAFVRESCTTGSDSQKAAEFAPRSTDGIHPHADSSFIAVLARILTKTKWERGL